MKTSILMAACLVGMMAGSPARAETGLFDPENLVAWCIVPFDASKRGPEERVEMLVELGLRKCAYDWRQEHVPEFEEEIQQYQKHGIEMFAFWAGHDEAFRLFEKYRIHPQIWRTAPSPEADTEEARMEAAVQAMLPLAQRTREAGCEFGLYNHGGWGGEPQNLVAVCEKLRALGHEHVGIVYNFHHAHDQIGQWKENFLLMKPYLICLNINGMNPDAQPKILPLGEGVHEEEMLRVVVESGYDGPIGILDHQNEKDAKKALTENLEGLKQLNFRSEPGS